MQPETTATTAQDLTGTVIWSSSDNTIATISATGLASAVRQESATIQAALGSVNGSALLTVTP